jgi:hypothetical protein
VLLLLDCLQHTQQLLLKMLKVLLLLLVMPLLVLAQPLHRLVAAHY